MESEQPFIIHGDEPPAARRERRRPSQGGVSRHRPPRSRAPDPGRRGARSRRVGSGARAAVRVEARAAARGRRRRGDGKRLHLPGAAGAAPVAAGSAVGDGRVHDADGHDARGDCQHARVPADGCDRSGVPPPRADGSLRHARRLAQPDQGCRRRGGAAAVRPRPPRVGAAGGHEWFAAELGRAARGRPRCMDPPRPQDRSRRLSGAAATFTPSAPEPGTVPSARSKETPGGICGAAWPGPT